MILELTVTVEIVVLPLFAYDVPICFYKNTQYLEAEISFLENIN